MPELVSKGAVGQVDLEVKRPAPRPLSLREMRAKTVARALEEYERSGFISASLREQIISDESAYRWSEGRPIPRDVLEKHVNEWAAGLLEKYDQKLGRRRKDVA